MFSLVWFGPIWFGLILFVSFWFGLVWFGFSSVWGTESHLVQASLKLELCSKENH